MTDRTKWVLIIGGCALVLGIVMQIPQFLYLMQPESKGILIHINSDEYQYLARVEEVLTGRPEQAAQPYLGDPYAPGMHYALIEQAEGLLFRWTKWRAATVFQVMDTVIPVLLFLAIFVFFRLSGFGQPRSLLGACLFVLPLLYSLNRPIHQRESFLLVLTTILLTIRALERRKILFTLLAGLLLGVLVGVYLWSWMFAWIYVSLLFLWEFLSWWRSRPRSPLLRSRPGILLSILGIGCIAASPFALSIIEAMRLPLYAEVAYRQGMHLTRLPESWIYSTLFLVMSIGLLAARRKHPSLRGTKQYAILFPMAVFVAIDQQVIHGHVIAFTSHFAFAIAFASVCAFLLATLAFSRTREPFGSAQGWRVLLLLPLVAGALMLGAIAWDNRPILMRLVIVPERFDEQHFATLLPVLDALPRTRILSDITTSAFIAGSTQHDIVSSIYLESAFLPNEEIAERWCLTVLPLPPADRHISEQTHLVWPDAVAANPGTDAREREVTMVEDACRRLDGDPAGALKRYGVQYVLWDEARQKEWDLKRLKIPLELVQEDPGEWVLYKIE